MTNEKRSDKKLEIKGDNYSAVVNLSPLNKRIVIKDYQGSNLVGLKDELVKLAKKENLTKIWVKAYSKDQKRFKEAGFKTEAVIDGFYLTDSASSMAYYIIEERKSRDNKSEKEELLSEVKELKVKKDKGIPENFQFKIVDQEDISRLAILYDKVFKSYPYPIDNEDYLERMMKENVIYGAIYNEEELVAAASAETVPKYKNAEMTDFATLPDYRDQGLARYLLRKLEDKLKDKNYRSLYTIARSTVFGINKIFSQSGYQYTGTLIKNCNIAGGLEDMNIWCKVIR